MDLSIVKWLTSFQIKLKFLQGIAIRKLIKTIEYPKHENNHEEKGAFGSINKNLNK
jgi:hypothetical protein